MAIRRILQLGDPLLRARSLPVVPAEAGTVLRDLEDTLAEFRRSHGFGRAISAIQIGAPVRVIFMQVDGTRYELLNPEFTWQSAEMFELWDDCFSFPNLMVRLRRHCRIRLAHQNRDGDTLELEADGAMAELIQHEMDHLDGILLLERLDEDQRKDAKKLLRERSLDLIHSGDPDGLSALINED